MKRSRRELELDLAFRLRAEYYLVDILCIVIVIVGIIIKENGCGVS